MFLSINYNKYSTNKHNNTWFSFFFIKISIGRKYRDFFIDSQNKTSLHNFKRRDINLTMIAIYINI